jgi:putative inorganic carbon (HCO3(-)) transporter
MNQVEQRFTAIQLSAVEWLNHSLLGKGMAMLQEWGRFSLLMQWSHEIGVVLIIALLAIAPFAANVTQYIGLLEVGCAALWLAMVCTGRIGLLSPIQGIVLVYWGIAALATLFSPVFRAALSGFIELTLYLMVFALMSQVVRDIRWRNVLITAYLIIALVVSVHGLRQWFFGAEALATWVDPESSTANVTRIYSYLGNPNLYAAYITPAIPLSLAALFNWKHWAPKCLAGSMFVLQSVCIVLTFSRGGWMALVAALAIACPLILYWSLPKLPKFWRTWAFPILIGGGVLVLLVGFVFVEPLRNRILSIFANRSDSSNNFRINVWEAVYKMIWKRPILGIGPGHDAFNQIYPLFQKPKFSALSAYSIYLEHLVEFGIIGFSCFMTLLFSLAYQGWRHLNRLRAERSAEVFWVIGALAAMGGLLTQGLFDTVWYRPQVFLLWWLMIAIVTSYFQDATIKAQVLRDNVSSAQ